MKSRISFFIATTLMVSVVLPSSAKLLTDLFNDLERRPAAQRKQQQYEYETARQEQYEHRKKEYADRLSLWNSSIEQCRDGVKQWRAYRNNQQDIERQYGRFAHLRQYPTVTDMLYTTLDRMQVRVSGAHRWAHAAYTSDSTVANLSTLSVSQSTPNIADMVTASQLANAGLVTSVDGEPNAANTFFGYLANTPVHCAARHEHTRLQLDLMYYLFDNLFAIGISIPYVQQRRAISMQPQVSSTVRQNIIDDVTVQNFSKRYGVDVFNFINDIIERQGMTYNPTFSRSGLSDITLYTQYRMGALYGVESTCALGLEMPAADGITDTQFYDAPMGNGGFITLKGDIGIIAKASDVLTPYITMPAAYGFETDRESGGVGKSVGVRYRVGGCRTEPEKK